MTLAITILLNFFNFITGNNYAAATDSFTGEVVYSSSSDSFDISKYRGKVVIVNYWASWSKASRTENKNLVRMYQLYKNNPKVVFVSISLDTDETSWKNAIEEDNLDWKNHFCDFKKYGSPMAKANNISTLPTSLLFDKSGILVKSSSKNHEIEAGIDGLLK